MKIYSIVFLLLLSGLTAKCQVAPAASTSSSTANTTGNPKDFASAGCVELGGSFSFSSESYTSTLLFEPYIGVFPIKGLELGLNPLAVSYQSFGNGNALTSFLFTLAPSYNFNTHSKTYPFIEGELGYISNSSSSFSGSSTGMCYGARTGVKIAIAPHVLVNIALQYLVFTDNSNGVSEESTNNLVVGVGFTVYL